MRAALWVFPLLDSYARRTLSKHASPLCFPFVSSLFLLYFSFASPLFPQTFFAQILFSQPFGPLRLFPAAAPLYTTGYEYDAWLIYGARCAFLHGILPNGYRKAESTWPHCHLSLSLGSQNNKPRDDRSIHSGSILGTGRSLSCRVFVLTRAVLPGTGPAPTLIFYVRSPDYS